MISSFIDGRVRFRSKELRSPDNMALVLSVIKAQDGVADVASNLATGSVLVHYDADKLPRGTLLMAASLLEKQTAPPEGERVTAIPALSFFCRGGRKNGRVSPLSPLSEALLLGGVFALLAGSGFISRRAHILLGLLFAVLAGVHVYDRRRYL